MTNSELAAAIVQCGTNEGGYLSIEDWLQAIDNNIIENHTPEQLAADYNYYVSNSTFSSEDYE